jgi:hypothetical protein
MIKIKVLDTEWKVFLHEDEDFCNKFPEEEHDAAFMMPVAKEVHFNEEELTLVVVKHELVHCFYDALCVEAAQLTLDQQEEVFCELIANHGDKILRLARILYRELKNA